MKSGRFIYRLGVHICVCLVCLFPEAHGNCPFPPTNEILQNDCDFSTWLPWNCACCGSDVINYQLAVRKRGICCEKISRNVSQCLVLCGYGVSDDTDYGLCSSQCPGHVMMPTSCTYIPTSVRHQGTTTVGNTDAHETTTIRNTGTDETITNADETSGTLPILLGSIGGCAILAGLLSCCIIFIIIKKMKRKNDRQKIEPLTTLN